MCRHKIIIISSSILSLVFSPFLDFQPVFAETTQGAGPLVVRLDSRPGQEARAVNRLGMGFFFAAGRLATSTLISAEDLSTQVPAASSTRLSPFWQVEMSNKQALVKNQPYRIYVPAATSTFVRIVRFYDQSSHSWRDLPSIDRGAANVEAHLPFSFVRLAVFITPKLAQGRASWYRHIDGNYAASPDYPLGSRLLVSNLSNNKSVEVVVHDFGPDRRVHPDRVVDLEKTAFAKIANIGAGVVDVRITYLGAGAAVPGRSGSVKASISEPKAVNTMSNKPFDAQKALAAIDSRSALAIDASTGRVLWSKNADERLPLASLTKLMAMHIFLKQGIDMKRVVAYRSADAELTHQWCEPWESARLRVSDGETMTVENLFYSALVGSANNAVETLVRISGLGRADFIAAMNAEALRLSAKDTKFIEPTGLAPDNVSSASDYAILSRHLLKNSQLKKASARETYYFKTINKKTAHNLKNTNRLISQGEFFISASKTGYLEEAGYCLMVQAERGSGKSADSVIVVTFGSPDRTESFAETADLIRYAFSKI